MPNVIRAVAWQRSSTASGYVKHDCNWLCHTKLSLSLSLCVCVCVCVYVCVRACMCMCPTICVVFMKQYLDLDLF